VSCRSRWIDEAGRTERRFCFPAGAYDLDAATTNGRVSKDGITSDPTSAHRVSAHATNGNVTLTESVG
jgi:hypothetical protein